MTAIELFYTWHSFDDLDQRDNWYSDLTSADKLALLEMRQLLESDPLIAALCERGGVVIEVTATVAALEAA